MDQQYDEVERVDDFFRNFLIRHCMHGTLYTFENEWHDLKGNGVLNLDELEEIPNQMSLNNVL